MQRWLKVKLYNEWGLALENGITRGKEKKIASSEVVGVEWMVK